MFTWEKLATAVEKTVTIPKSIGMKNTLFVPIVKNRFLNVTSPEVKNAPAPFSANRFEGVTPSFGVDFYQILPVDNSSTLLYNSFKR